MTVTIPLRRNHLQKRWFFCARFLLAVKTSHACSWGTGVVAQAKKPVRPGKSKNKKAEAAVWWRLFRLIERSISLMRSRWMMLGLSCKLRRGRQPAACRSAGAHVSCCSGRCLSVSLPTFLRPSAPVRPGLRPLELEPRLQGPSVFCGSLAASPPFRRLPRCSSPLTCSFKSVALQWF